MEHSAFERNGVFLANFLATVATDTSGNSDFDLVFLLEDRPRRANIPALEAGDAPGFIHGREGEEHSA